MVSINRKEQDYVGHRLRCLNNVIRRIFKNSEYIQATHHDCAALLTLLREVHDQLNRLIASSDEFAIVEMDPSGSYFKFKNICEFFDTYNGAVDKHHTSYGPTQKKGRQFYICPKHNAHLMRYLEFQFDRFRRNDHKSQLGVRGLRYLNQSKRKMADLTLPSRTVTIHDIIEASYLKGAIDSSYPF